MRVKVSVITVCYNSETTVRKTIESVLHQTYDLVEYIIVDGASNDATMSIVEEYIPKFENRVKIVSEPDKGIYDAMNKGICMASGELIGILNSDDFYENDAIENMVNAMSTEQYQILYGFVRVLKNGDEYSIERQSHKFLNERMIGHPACFVTKSVYNDLGKYDLQYTSVADYDFMLRMSNQKEVKFIPVDAIIANFALGGMSASNEAWLDLLKLKRNYGMISEKRYKRELLKDRVCSFHKGKR